MADLALGSSVLGAFLNVLFDRMGSRDFLNLFEERKRDIGLVKELNRKLLIIKVVLDDAEHKEIRNPDVREWLDQVHDAVYKVDDLLDLINTEALRVKVETEYETPNSNRQVSSPSPNSPQFSNEFLDEMMPKIEEMLEILEGFVGDIQVLGLENKKGQSKSQPSRLPSTSLVDETAVYGRDTDKEEIIQMLLSGSEGESGDDITVIPIVGLGGLGKTTLAQLVYNDERVEANFDTRAWVCISEEYDAVRITKNLLGELKISCSGDNLNSLQIQLQQGLAEKKFFLVLDDFWSKNYTDWKTLTKPFKDGKQGSKIIVTTRDESIAQMTRNGPIYQLHLMSEEDSWSLFEKHAFGNRGSFSNLELEEIGKDIVKKCKGLPLAVKTLGGLLRSKWTVEEWDDILKSDIWDPPENESGILPALRLSYNHLPSDLKQCFTYCAVFPKDYEFTKDQVILLWIANDLIMCPRNNKRLEDVGNECFRELTLRSFFQQSSVGKFSMHDLVNDLAKCSARFVGHDTMPKIHGTSGLRHFSYFSTWSDTFKKFELLHEATCLKTFLSVDSMQLNHHPYHLSTKFSNEILPSFRSLRVLSLSMYSITKLPNSFGNLKQLRFLDLSMTEIRVLPSWICALYNLQTLLLVNCRDLEELPRDIGKLINLRHLDISGASLITEMPVQMGRLKNLQYLSTFIISKDYGVRIEDLMDLCYLSGKLTISGLENVTDSRDAIKANMKGRKSITELSLIWDDDTDNTRVMREVFDNLRPHPNIERLTIEGYGGTSFPDWIGDSSFGHIKSLRLENCENCICLPSLGQLRCLEVLEIVGMSQISEMGKEIYGDCSVIIKPFPSLRVLRIERMQELKEWHVPTENDVFSELEELGIIDCPRLIGEFPKQLPVLRKFEVSGCARLLTMFQQFSSLQDLSIYDCMDLVSLPMNGLPAALKRLQIHECPNLQLVQTSSGETTGTTCHLLIEGLRITDSLKDKDIPLGLFPKLQSLYIYGCRNLRQVVSIPPCRSHHISFMSLRSLEIWACENLTSFPEGGLSAPNLNNLIIWVCRNLKSLPERMHTLLPSLRFLYIYKCPEIECFPEGGLPSVLQSLRMGDSEKLWSRRREWGLHKLPSLISLSIGGANQLVEEDWLLLPSNLLEFSVWFNDNLRTLSMQHLTSLQSLRISHCCNLQSVGEKGLPASLSLLEVNDCPMLKPRLEWEKGEDWPKVAHIPTISLDRQLIP